MPDAEEQVHTRYRLSRLCDRSRRAPWRARSAGSSGSRRPRSITGTDLDLHELREENRLTQVAADITLDKTILRYALEKRGEPSAASGRDALGDGVRAQHPGGSRIFTLVDVCTRAGVALHMESGTGRTEEAALLSAAGQRRGKPLEVVQCDQVSEFTAIALDHWAYRNEVQLNFSRPGNYVDNCICEAFNGSLRR